MTRLCRLWREGKTDEAKTLQLSLIPLCDALFCEVNPIPVKAAMAAMGFCKNYLRLPLIPMEADHEQMLISRMKEVGIHV